MRYINKKQTELSWRSTGLQLPKETAKFGKPRILTEDDFVNNKYSIVNYNTERAMKNLITVLLLLFLPIRFTTAQGTSGTDAKFEYRTLVDLPTAGILEKGYVGVLMDVYNTDTAKAIIMHYNGYNWNFINMPDLMVHFETIAVEHKSSRLVLSGTVYDPKGFVAKIYCWDGKELKELISGYGNTFITKLGDEIYATHN